jgi:hypothetical protein
MEQDMLAEGDKEKLFPALPFCQLPELLGVGAEAGAFMPYPDLA